MGISLKNIIRADRPSEPKEYHSKQIKYYTKQPQAIIISELKEILKKYAMEDKIKLIDYISEFCIEYPEERTSVDIISSVLSKRLYKEDNNLKRLDLESYIHYVFREYAANPKEFMKYILGDEWTSLQEKLNRRTPEYEKEIKSIIESELTNSRSLLEEKAEKTRMEIEENMNLNEE